MLTEGVTWMNVNLNQLMYLFTVNNIPITWCAKKQTFVSLSFTKLKYKALVGASKKVV
jgi:hypothetical protein